MPTKHASLQRIPKAGCYALQGLRALYVREAAFRQEVWLMALSTPWVWVLHVPRWLACAVTATAFLVLIAEAFNSALEALIDYLAPDHHVEAGYVKDAGSAAVLLTLVIWAGSWCMAGWLSTQGI